MIDAFGITQSCFLTEMPLVTSTQKTAAPAQDALHKLCKIILQGRKSD